MTQQDYKVANIQLAEFGRKEIRLAESEMPALMALRRKYQPNQPLKGARIIGCIHDGADGRAHRNAGSARRGSALVVLQHLLHAGSRGRGDGGRRHSSVRVERRNGRVLVVHRADHQQRWQTGFEPPA